VYFAAAILLAMNGAAAADDMDRPLLPGTFRLYVESDLLTLEARDAPLSEVVRAIAEQVGFETKFVGDLAVPVSTSLTGVPVSDGLERLVSDIDRVVLYAPPREGTNDRVVSQLWLFASNGAAASAAEPVALDDVEQTGDKTRAAAMLRLANADATEEALDRLVQALRDDEDALVRSRAATALGRLQDGRALSALETALEDGHASVRIQAIHALGQIGGERATMALGEVLLYSAQRSERVRAAWTLGRQDTELAQSFLDAAANDPDKLVWTASSTPLGRARRLIIVAPTDAEQRGSDTIR
jgi:hypothetical protein